MSVRVKISTKILKIKFLGVALAVFGFFCVVGMANAEQSHSSRLSSEVNEALVKKFPNAKITLPSFESLVQESAIQGYDSITSVRIIEDRPTGELLVRVNGVFDGESVQETIRTPYEAWVKVPVAKRRIYPSIQLKREDFDIREVNIATGRAREFRGVLASEDTELNRMESRQTILEGQFVTTSSIRKQPDIRRGDHVKLELISGDLKMSTQAIAQEAASEGDRIRVITAKTKREIVGKVIGDQLIEVQL